MEAIDPGDAEESFSCCTFQTSLFQFAEVRVDPLDASSVEVSDQTLEIAAYPTYAENTVSEKTAQERMEFFTIGLILGVLLIVLHVNGMRLLLVDFGRGGGGRADLIRVPYRSYGTVQIERIRSSVSASDEKRIRRSGVETVEIYEPNDLFVRRAVVVSVVIRRGHSRIAVVARVDAVGHERSVPRYREHGIVNDFPMDVPFENDDIARFFRSDRHVERGYRRPIAAHRDRIRVLGSRLDDLHLCHGAGRDGGILQLLDVAYELIPSQ